ncbi:tryptophan-rich sensory protein [Staphylococcus condimenti]|uniref:Tryptophan-rich sensory protein n=1 Tax=Staphylococcus condimenti TaxID=70255 RepID=A0AB37H3A5_9STAP|nr:MULTISPECIES: TspO/MBR family protein [Staphylococcus]AMY06059.1 TspO protein [Staphylococcus condimenti]APR59937.1 TspO protein [Staphylococcus condimenti]MDK8646178.1 TspO/MBR family protein [Staphylococcus condimenti]OFO99846.1 TspO protein [Staphylococcus sp. HMSC065E08]PNZ64023.1 tryptophan-rich sensory protein [Staphylococcus condimenti]
MNKPLKVFRNIVHLATPIVGGTLIGRYATQNARQDYQKEQNPPLSPPGITFPIVWSGLYIAMGIAYTVARDASKDKSIPILHYTQLGLNFLWSILYFRYKLRGAALIESYALFSAVIITAVQFYKANKFSGLIMIPYAMWCAFASYLATGSWLLNKEE